MSRWAKRPVYVRRVGWVKELHVSCGREQMVNVLMWWCDNYMRSYTIPARLHWIPLQLRRTQRIQHTTAFNTLMRPNSVARKRSAIIWRRGVAVECRICDQEVTGSSLSQAPWRKSSEQVSHTCVPLSPSSTTWYRSKGGCLVTGEYRHYGLCVGGR